MAYGPRFPCLLSLPCHREPGSPPSVREPRGSSQDGKLRPRSVAVPALGQSGAPAPVQGMLGNVVSWALGKQETGVTGTSPCHGG